MLKKHIPERNIFFWSPTFPSRHREVNIGYRGRICQYSVRGVDGHITTTDTNFTRPSHFLKLSNLYQLCTHTYHVRESKKLIDVYVAQIGGGEGASAHSLLSMSSISPTQTDNWSCSQPTILRLWKLLTWSMPARSSSWYSALSR